MSRHLSIIAGVATLIVCHATAAAAQSGPARPMLVGQEASAREGRVRGLVRDDAGRAIAGASILALGSAAVPVTVRSDGSGQFLLALPPGQYILRATRDGYVSTYREPVRIQSSTLLERNIVLVREGAASAATIVLAGASVPLVGPIDAVPAAADPDHAHTETAWRLRHLPTTTLRDVMDSEITPGANVAGFKPHPSFVDWMMGESARAAASYFSNTNFTGQATFVTTGALASTGGFPTKLPHGVAYLAVGAPVGSAGDWSLRGAMTGATLSSWVVMGEYKAREDRPHAFTAGVSYSSQLSSAGPDVATVTDRVRSVGGMYMRDRWHVRPAVEIDYGVRLDRYDYVDQTQSLSPRLGLRMRVLPETRVIVLAAQSVVAPGANEFLPPPSAGPWLPPERTFGPLLGSAPLRAERVRNLSLGLERQFRAGDAALTFGVRRFRESASDQVATLFGLNEESRIGHYYVATPGGVLSNGWAVSLSGPMAPRVHADVEYTASRGDWSASRESAWVAAIVPSVVRARQERLHDFVASLNTTIPETSTTVAFAFRVNSGYSAEAAVARPEAATRFDVELRQALPIRPTRTSTMELMIALRNLFRDPGDAGSLYDELLTVAPPMRIMGGVQVRF